MLKIQEIKKLHKFLKKNAQGNKNNPSRNIGIGILSYTSSTKWIIFEENNNNKKILKKE